MASLFEFSNIGSKISNGDSSMLVMAKYMKQELASDAEEEGLVPTLPGRFTSLRKVPSLSDLSDPESSLGKSVSKICLEAIKNSYKRTLWCEWESL